MKTFFEKIIHTIIPHEKNKNIPHILKEECIVVLAVFIGLLFYFNQHNFDIIRSLKLTATVYPSVLADLTNKDRESLGISSLTWNNTLEKAAKMKAEDMVNNSYFAHTSPSGTTPWHWLKTADYNFIYAGENLAVDFTESENVQKAWLNSPKHRENVLNSNFTEIGIATADGFFEGKNTTFVVEFFGKPSVLKTVEKSIVDNKINTPNEEKIVSPTVAGATTENILKEENKEQDLKVVTENEQLIIVKNENVTEEEIPIIAYTQKESLSTWYYRFIVNPTKVIKIIYMTFFGLVLLALVLMLLNEFKKHQVKHLFMGTSMIAIISVLLYLI